MDLTSLLFPVLILLLFIPIFLSGRRQRRQAAEMQKLQNALEPGDVVVTTSGLRATVADASYEETVDLEIADGVITTWVRAAIKNKVLAEPGSAELGSGDHETLDHTPADDKRVDETRATDTPADDDRTPESTEHQPELADRPDPAPSTRPSLTKDESTNGTARP